MNTQTIKAIILAVLLLIMVFVGWRWLKNHDKALGAAATIAQGQRTGEAAVGIAGSAVVAQDAAAALDNQVGTQRVEITHKYEVLKNENRTVRDFASAPVPRELRDLARDARLARDRLGGDETGSGLHDASPRAKRRR